MSILGTIFKGILGGISSSADSKNATKLSKEQIAQQGLEGRKTAGYTADMEWYYKQRERDQKMKGAGNYSQFNSLERFVPGYTPSAPPSPLPTKPTP